MGKKAGKTTMICPCCGQEKEIEARQCVQCGARQVGEALAQPDVMLPGMGPAMLAFGCGLLVIGIFMIAWIFSNDMKVGRVLVTGLFGDSLRSTKMMLDADPKLPGYRIFNYDALRMAFMLSVVLIPLSALGIWLARRARNLAMAAPERFGGLGLSRLSMVISTVWLVLFTAVTVSSIPRAIAGGRERRRAETRATMYRLHQEALQKYYHEYGSYPQELNDLSRVSVVWAPATDYWENRFAYTPVGEIASNGSAISLGTYRLVSAGSDGRMGTSDDLTMIDGVIYEGSSEDYPRGSEAAAER